ncbi:MAG: ATP-binding protein [Muribaculaceae bacterium]
MLVLERKNYAQKVDAWLGKGQIIVLIGQRRVGKSFIMKDFVARHGKESDANIIYIDKEQKDFNFIKNHEQLNDYIDAHFSAQKHNYILIDEVQDIAGWEHSVRSYRTLERTDVVITGSNSKMLSSELSTLLRGRFQEIHVLPLSYTEFLEFHNLSDSDEAFMLYMNYGGLPGLRNVRLENIDLVQEYLSGVLNTVVLKDVIERHTIRNVTFLNNLLSFIADTVGKLNSASSISKYMKSQQIDISTNIILSYMAYFNEALLTHSVSRYDIHGKKLLETNGKCYFGDVGLRNFIVGGERENDVEKVLENIVYLHLLRLGYTVKVGQLRAGEIDFVCTKHRRRAYVQVAYIIANEETRRREFGNLRLIPDDYPKYVISATPLLRRSDSDGITHLHIRDFLMEGI